MKKVNKILAIICSLCLLSAVFVGCRESSGGQNNGGIVDNYGQDNEDDSSADQYDATLNITPDTTDKTIAELTDVDEDNQIVFSNSGVTASSCTVSGTTVTITTAGTYSVSGSCDNGQIIVDAKKCDVFLVFNGLNLTCTTNAPIFIQKAAKVIITLTENTENYLSDTENYTLNEDEEPTATLFSKADLTINGSGKLTVDANYNNAIQSKDSLFILGGVFDVTSVDDGIIGKDYLYLADCVITADCGGDGLRSTDDSGEDSLGSMLIESGSYNLVCGNDGIQSANVLEIKGGTFNIKTGGGSANASSQGSSTFNPWGSWGTTTTTDTSSAKGLKASVNITVSGGEFTVDSSDDAIHSNANIVISGGTFTITSGDDGMHSDTELCISGGTITVTKSYEGIESGAITISGGKISITASDDGINVAGGADSSAITGRPGQNNFSANSRYLLTISGGTVYIKSAGDGLDSNGNIVQTGGIAVVEGPTDSANGSIDYEGSYTISGGVLIAIGSSGMAQMPSSTSTQCSVSATVSSQSKAFWLLDANDEVIIAFRPSKSYSNIVISTPDITKGNSYKLYTGGTITGNSVFGIAEGDYTYTGGSLACTFNVTTSTTSSGGSSGGGMGGRW